jgi:hypothetical protein
VRAAAAILTALTLVSAAPRLNRGALLALERNFDSRVQRLNIDDPFDLLGPTRAVYLERYGVVFSTEVNLVTGPAITPFRPQLSAADKERLRQKKLSRLPQLRQAMRDMMVSSATALRTLPESEQVVVGITLFYHPWEMTAGLPAQIVMQAPRGTLTDFEAGRIKLDGLNAAIVEQVY